jgi:lipopolysaccharide transport system ATP-binding protein
MSSESVALDVQGLGKCFHIYDAPGDRLRQFVMPRLSRLLGRESKPYHREFWALRSLDLQVAKGETIGIIGRNGSGKSTFLQMVCGTLAPSCGEVKTHGRIAALLELGAGFNPEFSGRDNVAMNAALLGLSDAQIAERFDSIAAFADIGEFIDQPVKTYSSGMYVRLAFAVIAHVDADILVVDEALAVGDAVFTQKCMRFLRSFMERGTLLFVSHDTAAIKSLCDRVVWIDKGQVMQIGPTKEVCDRYMQACYEAEQGSGPVAEAAPAAPVFDASLPWHDQRRDFFRAEPLRNDIQVFRFNPEAPSFGLGGARITGAWLMDTQQRPLHWVVGGEPVVLRIQAKCHQALQSPIVGFVVKDRTGQAVFGDNSYLSYLGQPVACASGQVLQAEFSFDMPRMPVGNYAIDVALADGSQHDHVQQHWIQDALHFKSESTNMATGLLGIPMRSIVMQAGQAQQETSSP